MSQIQTETLPHDLIYDGERVGRIYWQINVTSLPWFWAIHGPIMHRYPHKPTWGNAESFEEAKALAAKMLARVVEWRDGCNIS